MNKVLLTLLTVIVAGCATQSVGSGDQPARSGKAARYDCGTFSDGVLVKLPVAPLNAEVGEVTIIFHGEQMTAKYIRNGLKQLWYLADSIYIELEPTMTALYWDFTGAEPGEKRKPEAVFTTCKKRG